VPTVAAVQTAVTDLDPERNVERVRSRLRGLPDRVDLAVFPEHALTGFVADERIADGALRTDGPELDAVRDAAADAGVAAVVGYVEAGGQGASAGDGEGDAGAAGDGPGERALYNALAHVAPDGETTVYRKRHLWGGEASVLTPGEERVVVDPPVGRAGLCTCYDLNFVADSAALARESVTALLVAGAWPAAHSENWRLLLRARALDGVRWAVGAGRTGRKRDPDAEGEGTAYAGASTVVRPDGSVAAALARGERDLVHDLDPAVLADARDLVGVFDTPSVGRSDGV